MLLLDSLAAEATPLLLKDCQTVCSCSLAQPCDNRRAGVSPSLHFGTIQICETSKKTTDLRDGEFSKIYLNGKRTLSRIISRALKTSAQRKRTRIVIWWQ